VVARPVFVRGWLGTGSSSSSDDQRLLYRVELSGVGSVPGQWQRWQVQTLEDFAVLHGLLQQLLVKSWGNSSGSGGSSSSGGTARH
jgi:hypothetical protein